MPLRSQRQCKSPESLLVGCQLEGFPLAVHLWCLVLHLPRSCRQEGEYLLVDCQAGESHVAAHQWEGFHVAARHVATRRCQILARLCQGSMVYLLQAPIIRWRSK